MTQKVYIAQEQETLDTHDNEVASLMFQLTRACAPAAGLDGQIITSTHRLSQLETNLSAVNTAIARAAK